MPHRPFVTTRVHEVFALAHALAERHGHAHVTPSHLLLGMLREGRSLVVGILQARGIPLDALARDIELTLGASQAVRKPADLAWTATDEQVLDSARREAAELWPAFQHLDGMHSDMRRRVVGCEQLVLALLRDPETTLAGTFSRFGIGFAEFREAVVQAYMLSHGLGSEDVEKQ